MKPKAVGKITVTNLRVGGDPVSVGVDEAGRLSASTGFWVDPAGANERIAHSNIIAAKAVVVAARKAVADSARTAKSTKTKRKDADSHWSIGWLMAAREKHRDFGAERLALEARKMIALNGEEKPEYKRRNEVTEYRAKQFLKTARAK